MDLTPPWVVEQVKAAQAFIDRSWAEHLHQTVHVLDPDWRLGPDIILYSSVGDVQLTHVECRHCRIEAAHKTIERHQ